METQAIPAEYVVILVLVAIIVLLAVSLGTTIDRLWTENKTLRKQLEIEEAERFGVIIVAKPRCPLCNSRSRSNQPSLN